MRNRLRNTCAERRQKMFFRTRTEIESRYFSAVTRSKPESPNHRRPQSAATDRVDPCRDGIAVLLRLNLEWNSGGVASAMKKPHGHLRMCMHCKDMRCCSQ